MSNPLPDSAVAHPLGFSRFVLGLHDYPWQGRIFCDILKPGAVAVKAANGSGKTANIAAPAALWNTAVFPNSLTIVTAGVFRQVKEQFFPAIRRHSSKFPGWDFHDTSVSAPNGSEIYGFSTDDAGRFEGWHNDNLFMIVDEAKTVKDTIFEAISRCQPKRLLVMSSPGGPTGTFYSAFRAKRKFYRQHSVTAYECPHIAPSWIAEQVEKYGIEHPLIKSMIFAEFMLSGEDGSAIPYSFIERLLASPPAEDLSGLPHGACDFAAGGAENVFAVRRGNRVKIIDAWREKDTMKAVGRFIQNFKKEQLKAEWIHGDADGLGGPMIDALKEAGWPIIRFHGGSPAGQVDRYANAISEIWYESRVTVEKKECILPDDSELVSQLSDRYGYPNSKGKLALESKPDLAKRNVCSPDRADAVLMALQLNPVITAFQAVDRRDRYGDGSRIRRGEGIM